MCFNYFTNTVAEMAPNVTFVTGNAKMSFKLSANLWRNCVSKLPDDFKTYLSNTGNGSNDCKKRSLGFIWTHTGDCGNTWIVETYYNQTSTRTS